MKFIVVILNLIGWVVKTAVILAICSSILFVAYKGNQPMQVPEAPKGMTYFDLSIDTRKCSTHIHPHCTSNLRQHCATFATSLVVKRVFC